MTVAEATQLLKSTGGDQIKMEILPVRLVEQKGSRDSGFHNTGKIVTLQSSRKVVHVSREIFFLFSNKKVRCQYP